MADRGEMIRRAFAAYEDGDLTLLEALFAPDARWLGVPAGGETSECPDRRAIVEVLRRHRDHGRRMNDCIDESYARQLLAA